MTDFPKTLNVCSNCCPQKSIGIALSTSQEVQTFYPSSHLLSLSVLQKSFEDLEAREVSMLNSRIQALRQTNPKLWDLSERNEFPIHVEHAWYADWNSGGTYYYVEAHRRYSKAPLGEVCPNVSAYRGWIFIDTLQVQRVISSRMVLTDCDFKEAGFTTPLGLLELRTATFAIVQTDGWESQTYGILRLDPSAMTPVIDSPVR